MGFHQDGRIKHQRSNPLLLDTLSESQAICTWLEDASCLKQNVREVPRLSMLILRPILALRDSNQASEWSVSFSSRPCNPGFGKARRPKCQFPLSANDLIPFAIGGKSCLRDDHAGHMIHQEYCQQPNRSFVLCVIKNTKDMLENVHVVQENSPYQK